MSSFSRELKFVVWQRDEERCFRCKTSTNEGDVHHRLARKMGGANARVEWINWVSNLLFLCRECHNFIEANPNMARAAGWMLSAHQDPEDVLVYSDGDGLWYRLHGPQFYKDPLTGILAPCAGAEPVLWSGLMTA